jgi:hypothetical protein
MVKNNIVQLQTEILEYAKPTLIFSFDLDAIAGENEEYELVWNKLETVLISAMYTLSHGDKPAIAKQSFYLWGQLGTTLNAEEHVCNAYFIYIVPETPGEGIEEALEKSCEENLILWTLEELRTLDEECIPLFKYEQGNIIRYVFDQISVEGETDLGCSKIEFLTWDEDWHICTGAYSIDMYKEQIECRLSSGKKISILYRKFRIEPLID